MISIRHIAKHGAGLGCPAGSGTVVAPGQPGRCRSRLVVIWNATVKAIAPLGYEDQSGFHYGEMPNDRRTN